MFLTFCAAALEDCFDPTLRAESLDTALWEESLMLWYIMVSWNTQLFEVVT